MTNRAPSGVPCASDILTFWPEFVIDARCLQAWIPARGTPQYDADMKRLALLDLKKKGTDLRLQTFAALEKTNLTPVYATGSYIVATSPLPETS